MRAREKVMRGEQRREKPNGTQLVGRSSSGKGVGVGVTEGGAEKSEKKKERKKGKK